MSHILCRILIILSYKVEIRETESQKIVENNEGGTKFQRNRVLLLKKKTHKDFNIECRLLIMNHTFGHESRRCILVFYLFSQFLFITKNIKIFDSVLLLSIQI